MILSRTAGYPAILLDHPSCHPTLADTSATQMQPGLFRTPGIRLEYSGVAHGSGGEEARDVQFYAGEGATDDQRFANGRFLRTIDAPDKYRGHYFLPDRNNFAPRLGLAYDL